MSTPDADEQLEITDLDPHDDTTFERWYVCYRAALVDVVGEAAQVYELAETRVQWQQPTSDRQVHGYVGRMGEEVVAAGVLVLPQLDKRTSASVEVSVSPSHQCRRLGSRPVGRMAEFPKRLGPRASPDEGR